MRGNKYGVSAKADRTWNDRVYDSKLEMNYRKHLEVLKKAVNLKEQVASVHEQVPFDIIVNGIKICTYNLDFQVTYMDGRIEYIDCKGIKTAVYQLKKKLVYAKFNIKIKEITAKEFNH